MPSCGHFRFSSTDRMVRKYGLGAAALRYARLDEWYSGCPHDAPRAPDWMPHWLAHAPAAGGRRDAGPGDGGTSLDAEEWEHDQPVSGDIFWEGPPTTCDQCGKQIESAYGDPDEEDS